LREAAVATDSYTRFDFGFQPKLVLDFNGGQISGEAGLILLREFDERLRVNRWVGRAVDGSA